MQMLCKELPTLYKSKFWFLELSVNFFFSIFTPQSVESKDAEYVDRRVDCTTVLLRFDLKSNVSHLIVFLFAVLFSRLIILC